jgi:hypothetical protein
MMNSELTRVDRYFISVGKYLSGINLGQEC